MNQTMVFILVCSSGFMLETSCDSCGIGEARVKGKCVDANECESSSGLCGNHSVCFNTYGSYYCQCQDGFKNLRGQGNFTTITGQCQDINECVEDEERCDPNAYCTNLIGSYTCTYAPVSVWVEVSAPDSTAEGSSVDLTCNSDADPPVDNYTWYQRVGPPGSSSVVQVGWGQVLVVTSLQSSHTGRYFCHTGSSLGENNSTEVLLVVITHGGRQRNVMEVDAVILRVVIGVKLLAVLLFPLVMLWVWKHDSGKGKEEDKHQRKCWW